MGKSTFEERKKKPLPASSKPAPKSPAPMRDSGKESNSTHNISKVGVTSASGKEDPQEVVDRVLAAGNKKEDKEAFERITRGPKGESNAYIKRIQEENSERYMSGERTVADRVEMGEYAEKDRKAVERVLRAGDPKENEASLSRVMAQHDEKESAATLDRVLQGLEYPRELSAKEKSTLEKIIADGVVSLTPQQKITGEEYADTAAIAEYLLSQKSAESVLNTTEEAHPLSHDPLFGLSSEHTRNSPVFETYRKNVILPQYKRFYKQIHPPKELKAK